MEYVWGSYLSFCFAKVRPPIDFFAHLEIKNCRFAYTPRSVMLLATHYRLAIAPTVARASIMPSLTARCAVRLMASHACFATTRIASARSLLPHQGKQARALRSLSLHSSSLVHAACMTTQASRPRSSKEGKHHALRSCYLHQSSRSVMPCA